MPELASTSGQGLHFLINGGTKEIMEVNKDIRHASKT
jgi:hypothetical protein